MAPQLMQQFAAYVGELKSEVVYGGIGAGD